MVSPGPIGRLAEPAGPQSVVVPKGSTACRPVRFDATASEALVDTLVELGVEYAFGLLGGAIAPLSRALHESSIKIVHFRHEAGAAFAAIEASLASGKPVAVFATTGPGLTNCLTGMAAARWEGAKVIFVTGATSAAQRGRWAFQETSAYTLPVAGVFTPGPLCHFAACIENPAELEVVASRLAAGCQRSGGFVAHVAMPLAIQTAPTAAVPARRVSSLPPRPDTHEVERIAQQLASGSFVVWAGFGARGAARQLREFAELSGAPVMCSPRGKGIFPESHPQYLGVTGLGGHPGVLDYLRRVRPARIVVLGTRLGEFTSFWDDELEPPAGFIHVDVDADVFGAAYPNAPTVGVQSDVGDFLQALVECWPDDSRRPPGHLREPAGEAPLAPTGSGPVRPRFLMEAVQRKIVEGTDAIVITEAGNSFALGSHYLHFDEPGRYRVSTGFGSMGHAVGGVVGAALAHRGKAVAIAGDGAMLMLNEMSTAAQCGADALWIVLNDSRYGMIEQGMKSLDWTPFQTGFPRADFALVARGVGIDGRRVQHEYELAAALDEALERRGPFVLDVLIDPEELAPSGRRNRSLVKQGAAFAGSR